jgi:Family of unknown function (DUF6129)
MDAQEIAAIVKEMDDLGFGPDIASRLRARFPARRFTECSADDLGDQEPYLRRPGYQIHLLESSGHCLSLTQHVEAAIGLVLASTDGDEADQD